MSEPQPGKGPEQPPDTEKEHVLYHRAARYPSGDASKEPYTKNQELVRDTPCNLSVYRLRMGEDIIWHVVVIGSPPGEDVDQRIIQNLSTGESVTLPDWAVEHLYRRRAEVSGQGQYVEKHHSTRQRRTR